MSSVSSLLLAAPDRILSQNTRGGTAISELTLANNSVRAIWKGAEGFHAFGISLTLPLSKDGKVFSIVRSSYETPPEVWAGPAGAWRQLTVTIRL